VSKKKRKKKTTVYIVFEGKREEKFYCFLKRKYKPESVHINSNPEYGGSSDKIVQQALNMKNNYNKVYAWFDEDKSLSAEIRAELAKAWNIDKSELSEEVKDSDLQSEYNKENRNPILIVSNPCSVDGFLIKLCGGSVPKTLNTDDCKNTFNNMVKSCTASCSESEYYEKNLTKDYLESKKSCLPILELILSIFEEASKKS
jgi:hypothetical protein